MRGEFDSLDPLGVAAGARIKADCSLNWVDPDDGKLYCFASGTSLEFFLEQPQTHLERARDGLAQNDRRPGIDSFCSHAEPVESRRRNPCVADSHHRDYLALDQKNKMPPSAKSFSLAESPPQAVDLVLMYSPTNVTLFVRL